MIQQSSLTRKEKFSYLFKTIVSQRWIYFMVLPGVLWMIIFNYIPMYGIIIAFKNYTIFDSIAEAPWVGLKNFIDFFQDDKFLLVMQNTLGISILKLVVGFPLPILLAIMLNELYHQRFKKYVQTVTYLPHFFSWVVLGGMLLTLLSETGVVNEVLQRFDIGPIQFLTEAKYFWSLTIFSDIWKELGWNAIIYLAAIAGIDPSLYEAATIDGASKLQKIFFITLPSITGIISILLILAISGILTTNFEQILVMQNSLNVSRSEVIDTLVYKVGLQSGRFSYAAAVGLFKSIIAMVLLFSANYTSKKLNNRGIF